jgi:hypothetical protein
MPPRRKQDKVHMCYKNSIKIIYIIEISTNNRSIYQNKVVQYTQTIYGVLRM